jgi:hypothetical protein
LSESLCDHGTALLQQECCTAASALLTLVLESIIIGRADGLVFSLAITIIFSLWGYSEDSST